MAFGLLITFLALLFAVQFLFDLYATSVINGHAFDAARDVASFEHEADRVAAVGRAEADLRAALNGYDGDLELSWSLGPDSVELTVVATHPSVMPSVFRPLALDEVDTTVFVRAEEPR